MEFALRSSSSGHAVCRNEEEQTFVGVLTQVHVHGLPQRLIVQVGGQAEIPCYFDDLMRDAVAHLRPGSIVEVTGWPILDQEGQLKQIDAITAVDTISMEPLHIVCFEHEGRLYRLREPLRVSVEYIDGMWFYANESINLSGHGQRRAEAMRDLNESFDYLWREFALERDELLDGEALLIKRRLLSLVENPQSHQG